MPGRSVNVPVMVCIEADMRLSPLVGGGCVLPLTTYSPIGTDCTAIPGVADVDCQSGKCVVRRCLRGYIPAVDGTSCNPEHPPISQPDITGLEEDIELALARVFGLEHVPLERN